MAVLGWTASKVMQEHLQNLMTQEYTTVAELVACHMPEDSASPVLAGGCIVACVAFYE
jgi:flagellar motor switch protein FliG